MLTKKELILQDLQSHDGADVEKNVLNAIALAQAQPVDIDKLRSHLECKYSSVLSDDLFIEIEKYLTTNGNQIVRK